MRVQKMKMPPISLKLLKTQRLRKRKKKMRKRRRNQRLNKPS
jgi:hypothetical protein